MVGACGASHCPLTEFMLSVVEVLRNRVVEASKGSGMVRHFAIESLSLTSAFADYVYSGIPE